jgi:hypothetical protein
MEYPKDNDPLPSLARLNNGRIGFGLANLKERLNIRAKWKKKRMRRQKRKRERKKARHK